MISVDKFNNVLSITSPGANGLGLNQEFYQFSVMKSVSWIKDSKDDYYVIINFIANDKNNSLRIKMGSVSNQLGWTNDESGAYIAAYTMSQWMNPANVNGNIRTPTIYNASVTGATSYGAYAVSIANVGAANGTVNGAILTPGTTINFDGGAMNHQIAIINFDSNLTTFLITELH
jgi:hypothetical protein